MGKRSDFVRRPMDAPRRNRGSGKGLAFVEHALSHEGDDCLIWPFYIMKNGYGQIGTHSGMALAHRYVCERAHGLAPKAMPQAAHSCGNKACVNPRHLRWASQKDNEDDKLGHGTWFGRLGGAKLTETTVLAIRADAATGVSGDALSEKYQTPLSTIRKIVKRHTWKHV